MGALFIFLLIAWATQGQVMVRNSFTFGKNHKLKNLGISFVAINLDRHPNLNMLVNGRGGRSLVIDVAALTHRDRLYTYRELAEKVYTPGATYQFNQDPVPMFLLMEPPKIRIPQSYLKQENN